MIYLIAFFSFTDQEDMPNGGTARWHVGVPYLHITSRRAEEPIRLGALCCGGLGVEKPVGFADSYTYRPSICIFIYLYIYIEI